MISGKVLSCDWVNSHHSNVVFRGELENRFFRAAKDKNKHAQLAILNNIKFDVFEREATTGNNFLHIVCIDGSAPLLQKALKLLRINKEKIDTIINTLNNDNKYPLDYLNDNKFKQTVYSLFKPEQNSNLSTENLNNDNVLNNDPILPNDLKELESNKDEKVGNEISEPINISNILFGDEDIDTADDFTRNGLDAIVGLEHLKQVFTSDIIKPLKDGRNVFTNGFLLYGLSGNGKTFSIEKLAESQNRSIIDASLLISTSEKMPDKTNELIENNIIKIDPDEIREIGSISGILKKHFIETNKQGFVFIDDIQKFFPRNSTYINNINAMQVIENSERKGMILLATKNDIEEINK